MSSASLAIVAAAGVSATALVALCLTPRRPEETTPSGRDRTTPARSATAGGAATTGELGTGGGTGADGAGVLTAERAEPAAGGPQAGAKRPLGERIAGSKAVRRSLGGLTAILVLAAGVSITWPFWTDQYQSRLQVRLERQLEEQIESPEAVEEFTAGQVATGDSLTRLKIPDIGVDVVVVEGTTQAALRAGAGHYPETALPCGTGNVAIAGHRTTFGKPFNRLDEVPVGAEITLETPVGTCRYRVGAAATVITPDQVEVVAPTDTPRLTLTTCHPKGSARQRLVLQADLVGEPLLDGLGGQTPPDIRGEA